MGADSRRMVQRMFRQHDRKGVTMTTTHDDVLIGTAIGLTYAERRLIDGRLDAGILSGFATGPKARAFTRAARAEYAAFRKPFGYASAAAMLTQPDAQAKLGKSERWALGLMLTPAASLDTLQFLGETRPINVCPKASAGCAAACLSQSGHGQFAATQKARQVRHAFLLRSPFAAGVLIGSEIRKALDKHGADNVTFRFNVVSDYRIEFIIPNALAAIMEAGVRTYDYSAWTPTDRQPLPGYEITYSAKESAHTSDFYLANILSHGFNVAMPFHGRELPATYTLEGQTFAVINGDATDDRTTDPRGATGVIVGLLAKGRKGKADTSGFIRNVS